MLKNMPVMPVFFVVCILFASCSSASNPVNEGNVPAVIVTRGDDLRGNVDVYVDGRKLGKLEPGGKWGWRLRNGRHTISVVYEKKRSDVIDFGIRTNRQNFRVTAFLNDKPNLIPF